jgi:hypothetical protein
LARSGMCVDVRPLARSLVRATCLRIHRASRHHGPNFIPDKYPRLNFHTDCAPPLLRFWRRRTGAALCAILASEKHIPRFIYSASFCH